MTVTSVQEKSERSKLQYIKNKERMPNSREDTDAAKKPAAPVTLIAVFLKI